MAIKPHKAMCTDEVIDEICTLVENGNYIKIACAASGVNYATFSRWRSRGRDLIELHPEMEIEDIPDQWTWMDQQCFKVAKRIEVSDGKAEAYAVLIVRKHMPDQWTAAMTFLERRFPERWRKRQTIESVDGGSADGGLDEAALIEDPEAVRLLHQALGQIARRKPELPVLEVQAKKEPPAEAEGSPD